MSIESSLPSTSWRQLVGTIFLKGNRSEVVAAALVVAIVISMILPLPLWLLDILIALNISVACFLIVFVMQIKETVHLSTFPALLLITTLFRVSINVASTRQILLEGNAGHIIEAFGEVVVGGNLIVGLVVFTILTLIQFLVITKGSERVAEVGARFTLDAMPGKQLAIDIEVKSGNITSEEAQKRRAMLAMESQFFGAMDGALKFVKGDTIAGILITLTNLIGGMVIGITQRGMNASDAAKLYSILSIGDALVAQIPALLTSITAGLLITRISGHSEQTQGNMGKQITHQLTSYPKSWITASLAMSAFGLVPGMPWFVFFTLGIGSLTFGLYSLRKAAKEEMASINPEYEDLIEKREFKPVFPFLLRFDKSVADQKSCMDLVRLARRTRNRLVMEYGLVAPAIETESEVDLDGVAVEFCHNEVRVFAFQLPVGNCVLICPLEMVDEFRESAIKIEESPIFRLKRIIWLPSAMTEELRQRGLDVVTDWEWVENQLRSALFKLAPKHFGIEQASRLMKWLGTGHPELAKELERIVPLQRLSEILQRLLSERVSIRNVNRIIETLVEWGQRERDPAVLVECVRNALSREIANSYASSLSLNAVVLDPTLEEKIRDSIRQTAFGDYVALDNDFIEAITDEISDHLSNLPSNLKAIVLTGQDIRVHVWRLIHSKFDDLAVLSASEVPSDFKITVLGVVGGSEGDGRVNGLISDLSY